MIPLVFGMVSARWLSQAFNIFKEHEQKKQRGLIDLSSFNLGGNSNIMGGKYNDRKVSDWVLSQVRVSEGLERKAYAATPNERTQGIWTIGYGTCYLYFDDGRPFITNFYKGKIVKGGNGVRPTDTLQGLKSSMGYSSLSDSEFGTRLIRNHTYARGGAYERISTYFDMMGLSFNQAFKDAIQEWAYGSQQIVDYVKSSFSSISNVLKLNRIDLLAAAYINLRLGYYLKLKAWNTKFDKNALGNRYSWMKRAYVTAMHIKGINVSMRQIEVRTWSNGHKINRLKALERYIKSDLGVNVKLI